MSEEDIMIRRAERNDMPQVMAMIQELADFEKMSDGPKINAEILQNDCFDNVPPLFQCFVVEIKNENRQNLIGYSIFFNTYSTWEGKSLMIEDIYVKPEFRSTGIGKRILSTIAEGWRLLPERGDIIISFFRIIVSNLFENPKFCTHTEYAMKIKCCRVDLHVLKWNPARRFYELNGAIDLTGAEEWLLYRFNKDALIKLAK